MPQTETAPPLAAWLVLLASCGQNEAVPLPSPSDEGPAPWNPGTDYDPEVRPQDLSTRLDNPLFPGEVGTRWIYEGKTDKGTEHIEVEVLEETRMVWGVAATVIRDTVHLDGALIEDTWDWYAQDDAGNVWYLGEETHEYAHGKEVCACGSWESGVDGALPGIVMLAAPKLGRAYRQEYYAHQAEDLAELVALGIDVTVPAGTYHDCVKTRDLSAVERDVEEFKYACPGVGVVLEEEGDERVELVEFLSTH